MPGFITHYICGQAVLHAVPQEAENIIRQRVCLYNMGAQGPDIFFYYLPGLLKKRTRGVGVQMHRQHSGVFLEYLADGIRHAETTEEKHILFAYTAGFLTHYALDVAAHPYVYARTGDHGRNGKRRPIRHSVNHRKFETAIDTLMLRINSSQKPADYKLWQLIRADARQTKTAADMVSKAVRSAYRREVNPGDVYNAMAYMVHLTRLLQSKTGRRKRLMELIEDLTVGAHVVSSVIHTQKVKDHVDYMNLKKNPWHAPWDKESDKTDSFMDLYQEAVADAADMVSLLYAFMENGVSRARLRRGIGNRSMKTGEESE